MRRPARAGHRACTLALVLLGVSCSGESGSGTAQQIIDELASQQFGRASTRYRAAEDEVLSPAAAPTWRRALEHDDTTVREWAVDALSRIGMEGDGELVALRLGDVSRGVRQLAIDGLVRMDPELARREFETRLGSADPEQVVVGAQGIARLGATEASGKILERLVDERLPAPTRAALTGPLATLGDPAAAPTLVDVALDVDASLQLRRLAAEAAVVLTGPGVREAIERLVDVDDEYIRALAEEALRSG